MIRVIISLLLFVNMSEGRLRVLFISASPVVQAKGVVFEARGAGFEFYVLVV